MSLTAKQLEIRRTGITSSDLRALTGKDSYGRGPHDVFLDKMNAKAANDWTLEKELGAEIEPIVLRHLAADLGLRIVTRLPDDMTVRHPKIAHHVATPDAWLSTQGGTVWHAPVALAEVKVVGFHMRFDWGETGQGEIPEGTRIQATWEAHCSGIPLVHVGALLGTELRRYAIPLEPDLEGELCEVADRFWTDHVLTKKPPKVDGSPASEAIVRALYPKSRPMTKAADKRAEMFAGRYFTAERDVERATFELEKARQALMVLAGDAEKVKGDGWAFTYKTRKAFHVGPKAGYDVEEKRLFKMLPR